MSRESGSEIDGKWVIIQRNPRSGSGKGKRELLRLVSELKARSFRVRMFANREKLDAWLAESIHADQLRCIVGAGGDGTLGDLLNRHPGQRIAILPLGTENLMAKFLRIGRDGKRLAAIIAANKSRVIDVGEVTRLGGTSETRRFAIMLSAGFDGEVVHRTDAIRTGNISKLTYLKPIFQAVRRYQYPELRITIDEGDARTARMVTAVNVPAYAMGLTPAKSANPADGLFDVRLFRKGSAFHVAKYLLKIVLGTVERAPDVHCQTGQVVRVESGVPIPVQIDGDPAGFTPLEIKVIPQALELLVP